MLAMRKQHKMDDLHEEWAYKECVHTESFPNQAFSPPTRAHPRPPPSCPHGKAVCA